MIYEGITKEIIGGAIKVHKRLGPGLLESAYHECLKYELSKRSLMVTSQIPQPIIYEQVKLNHGYRIDLLVENKIVWEIKTVDALSEVHFAQVLTYLRLGNYKLGLLINFHVALLKDGIKRIIN